MICIVKWRHLAGGAQSTR